MWGVLGHLNHHENVNANHLHGKVLSTYVKVMHPPSCDMLKGILVKVLEGPKDILVVGTLKVKVPCIKITHIEGQSTMYKNQHILMTTTIYPMEHLRSQLNIIILSNVVIMENMQDKPSKVCKSHKSLKSFIICSLVFYLHASWGIALHSPHTVFSSWNMFIYLVFMFANPTLCCFQYICNICQILAMLGIVRKLVIGCFQILFYFLHNDKFGDRLDNKISLM